jgi:hypothetical protein
VSERFEGIKKLAIDVLGHDGRMISHSRPDYRARRPSNIVVSNSHIAVTLSDGDVRNLWHGDIDLTLWEERLIVLARLADQPLHLFYESDGHETYDRAAQKRALATFHPHDGTLIPLRTASYIARADDGTLRFVIWPDTRKRFSWRVFAHRPKLWRFWHLELRYREQEEAPLQRSKMLYVGLRSIGRAPLLVIATSMRRAALETIRRIKLTWYPADGETRCAERSLLDLTPHLRVGSMLVWAGLIVWPGFMYELLVGFSRQQSDASWLRRVRPRRGAR